MKDNKNCDGLYTSRLEFDLDAVKRNALRIQKAIGGECSIIGVIKGNGYGYGLKQMASFLTGECGVQTLAVAHVCEGVQLRESGIANDILMLTAIPRHLIRTAAAYRIQVPVFSLPAAEMLEDEGRLCGEKISVHIKLETGMNRIGVRPGEELDRLLRRLKESTWLEVAGAYTHFATSRIYQNSFTKEQLARFEQGLAQVRATGFSPRYVHAANSGAVMWLKEAYFTHVRCASLFLGYARLSNCEISNPLHLEDTSAWRTQVVHMHDIPAGETLGYGRHFKADKLTTVALIGVGSNDGMIREAALNHGPVLINGRKTRYLGTCMDQSFIDVTDIPCQIGDTVTIWGKDGDQCIQPTDLLQYAPYMTCSQCFTNIGPRVARYYKREGGKTD